MKAQSELTGDRKRVAEMTTPHNLSEATDRMSIRKALENTYNEMASCAEPVYDTLSAMSATIRSAVESPEVNIASRSGNAVTTTSQIRWNSPVFIPSTGLSYIRSYYHSVSLCGVM